MGKILGQDEGGGAKIYRTGRRKLGKMKLLFVTLFVCVALCSAEEEKKKDEEKDKKDAIGTVIGIDLGTTYSCVGVFKNGRVEIIPNDQGNRITPSYVAFTSDGERLIGDAAKNQLTSNPENTVFDAKRLIGREWSDSAVQHDMKFFPFKLTEKNKKPHIQVNVNEGETKQFAAEEISAMVLVKMKETAEAYLGKKVTHAVVTVPAYFNDAKMKEKVDAKNEFESYAYSLKNQIKDKDKLGGKLSEEDKASLEKSVDEAIAWLESHADATTEELKAEKKKLEDIATPIVSKLYQGQAPPGGEGAPGGEEGGPSASDEKEDKDEL